MLETFAIAVAILFVVAALIQAGFAIAFVRLLNRSKSVALPPEKCPKAAVLLALRGADTRLDETLRRLANQDHPDYYVQLIIDNEKDPAAAVARSVIKEPRGEKLRLSFLQNRHTTCGLQCSAFAQGIDMLDPEVQHVVTIDGDVLTHPSWLRELVAPFEDPKVGATFGNRWFASNDGRWGSYVRHLWNAAAIVPMWIFEIPWGGAMGLRREVLTEYGLCEQWKTVMVHDAPVPSILKQHGLRLQFIPSLMMPIGDACGMAFCLQFLTRQMLWTKLYHPNFAPVVLHALVTSGLALAIGGAALVAVFQAKWVASMWLIGSTAAYLVAMIALLWMIDRAVGQVLYRRGESAVRFGWMGWARLATAIPLAQFVYTYVTIRAAFLKKLTWRGVTYVIRSPFDVSKVQDEAKAFEGVGRGTSL